MFICLYNYSATTEIYTYCPTHSLHDALPIFDHILHLEGGKVTLYPGGYDAFERQRAERAAQLAAAKAAQDAQRAKLQDYIARNSARASTAKQAQSRAKQLARMQRSEEHTSELQSLMRNSYAVFCLKKKNQYETSNQSNTHNN